MVSHKHLLFALFTLFLCACKTTEKQPEATPLFTIGDESFFEDEFLYAFNKNRSVADSVYTEDDLQEYLELFVNFKLKVKEAYALDLHESPEFKAELEEYTEQLAKPYLTHHEVREDLVEQAYERMQYEVKAAHILFEVDENAAAEDTLAAYNKALAVKKEIESGKKFGEMARKHSDDPSVVSNQGALGYFSAFQMVFPFEEAAYTTAVGGVSDPVRTQFGYHLVKVEDKRKNRGQVKVSHLMINAPAHQNDADSIRARKVAFELYETLQQGSEWAATVQQFSEDRSTKNSGGALPWFGSGSMLPEIEQAAFALSSPGDMHAPVKTVYGWHIIRLDAQKPLAPFKDMQEELNQKISRDARSGLHKSRLLAKLKETNDFQENSEQKTALFSYLQDSTKKPVSMDATLMTLADSSITMADFLEAVPAPNQDKDSYTAKETQQAYDNFVENLLLDFERQHLEERHPEYKMLVQEYKEGIMLFQLMTDEVWNKALEDTTGLKAFFESRREDYQWGERAKLLMLSAANDSLLSVAQSLLEEKPFQLPEEQAFALSEQTNLNRMANAIYNRLQQDSLKRITLAYNKSKSLENEQINALVSLLDGKGLTADHPQLNIVADADAPALSWMSSNPKDLEKVLNQTAALNLQVTAGTFEAENISHADAFPWKTGQFTFEKNGRNFSVEVYDILKPAFKELNEVRGTVISDYQDHLEKTWIEALKTKYPVQINDKVLGRLQQ